MVYVFVCDVIFEMGSLTKLVLTNWLDHLASSPHGSICLYPSPSTGVTTFYIHLDLRTVSSMPTPQ